MLDPTRRIIDFKLGGPALLMHCDADKGTAQSWDSRWGNYTPDFFIDSSSHGHIINKLDPTDPPYQYENPIIVGGGKFGSCIRSRAATQKGMIFWEHHDAFNFAGEDFTIDFWGKADALNDWYWNDQGGSLSVTLRYPMTGITLYFGFHDYTQRNFVEMYAGGYAHGEYDPSWYAKTYCRISVPYIADPVRFYGNTKLLAGQWYHFALVRNLDVFYIYLNGQLEASAPLGIWNNFASPKKDPEPPPYIWPDDYHSIHTQASWDDYVYIDELRIIEGAQYTGPFTPPAEPYQ